MLSIGMWAVPAYRGWLTRSLSDGTPVTVRQNGDEFFHYWETADGRLAIEQADGTFVLSDEALPTPAKIQARRAAARAKRMPQSMQSVGYRNLAPKGVVILVNFSDIQMDSAHTQAVFNDLCNATNCTTNVYDGVQFGSAAQYFADQSNGAYRPQFDVFGPVTLPHPEVYYGEEGDVIFGQDTMTFHHLYIADFVIDAVLAADSAGCDFSQYDSDQDGLVDFVYFIFAGIDQAQGGGTETIWPHNWSLMSALYFGRTHGNTPYYCNNDYDYNMPTLDGVIINNYACSAELNNSHQLCGIGTLCHEFGHVMGLPDFYDTNYGANYDNHLTPNEWNIMDGGSYNGGGHCPPNYDPWEKQFFGWLTPVNPGSAGADITLQPNGSADYNVCQINASGTLQEATTGGWCYYLENRQKSGWDTHLPQHGMLIWKVNYDEDVWRQNAPNNTADQPRYTLVCSSGTAIGLVWEYNTKTGSYYLANDGTNNVFGEVSGVRAWEDVQGKPVTQITETDSVISFLYKGGAGSQQADYWFHYDDGEPQTGIGLGGDTFYWGILIPKGSQSGDQLKVTKLSVYEAKDANTQPIQIDIYRGGDVPAAGNLVYQQTVTPRGRNGFHEITLSEPVALVPTENFWIVLSEGTDEYPAIVCADTGDKNGRWISTDGLEWFDMIEEGLNYTFMIRAYIDNEAYQDLEQVPVDNIHATKFLHNGQIYLLRDGKIYDVLGRVRE